MAEAKSKFLRRANGVLGLFIGIFGALAILGVFFKIAKYPNYEIFMAIGFFGEAAAFVVMGVLALLSSFSAPEDDDVPVASGLALGAGAGVDFDEALRESSTEFRGVLQSAAEGYRASMEAASAEFRDGMQAMLHEHLSAGLGETVQAVQGDVEAFGIEMRGLGGEMSRAREAVASMSTTLEAVSTGTLADDAGRLGTGMRQLGDGMAEAGTSVDRMRNDLNEMAARFHAFNGPARISDNGDGAPREPKRSA